MTKRRKKHNPPTLQIGPHSIKIRFTDDWTFIDFKNGLAHSDKMELVLSTELLEPGRESMLREVVIHECIHHVSNFNDMDLSEQQVRILGLGLAQMLEPFIEVEL